MNKQVYITWTYTGISDSDNSDPDYFFYQVKGLGQTDTGQLSGDTRYLILTLPSGNYHFEIFATKDKADSKHTSFDFTVN